MCILSSVDSSINVVFACQLVSVILYLKFVAGEGCLQTGDSSDENESMDHWEKIERKFYAISSVDSSTLCVRVIHSTLFRYCVKFAAGIIMFSNDEN